MKLPTALKGEVGALPQTAALPVLGLRAAADRCAAGRTGARGAVGARSDCPQRPVVTKPAPRGIHPEQRPLSVGRTRGRREPLPTGAGPLRRKLKDDGGRSGTWPSPRAPPRRPTKQNCRYSTSTWTARRSARSSSRRSSRSALAGATRLFSRRRARARPPGARYGITNYKRVPAFDGRKIFADAALRAQTVELPRDMKQSAAALTLPPRCVPFVRGVARARSWTLRRGVLAEHSSAPRAGRRAKSAAACRTSGRRRWPWSSTRRRATARRFFLPKKNDAARASETRRGRSGCPRAAPPPQVRPGHGGRHPPDVLRAVADDDQRHRGAGAAELAGAPAHDQQRPRSEDAHGPRDALRALAQEPLVHRRVRAAAPKRRPSLESSSGRASLESGCRPSPPPPN